jgi:coenzyme F420-reducing hydrogenase gamma subunit
VTCKTGGVWSAGGATPFIRGEVTWKNGVPWYNLSPLYGYNRSLKINTHDPKCDTFQCNINSGCPVPGPDGTCFAPCCASAQGCEGKLSIS